MFDNITSQDVYFLVLTFILGCFANAMRGGQFKQWKRILKAVGVEFDADWKPVNKLNWWQRVVSFVFDSDNLNAFVFFLAVALIPSMEYQGNGVYESVDPNWRRAAFAGLAMFAGASIGWGDYIGALGGWRLGLKFLPGATTLADYMKGSELYNRYKPLAEWPPIDKFLKDFEAEPKKWGFYGLTLRGLVWGFLIGLALNGLSPMVGGTLMGCFFWIGIKWGGRESGWEKSEWIFGGPFWLASIGSLILTKG